MKEIFKIVFVLLLLPLTLTSCLYSGLDDMENSSDKELI